MVGSGAHFLVLGAGGLGCPAALALVAAGANRLTLVDHDVVEGSNLHRQVLYTLADVGRAKIEAARQRLRARAPDLAITGLSARLVADDLRGLLADQPGGTIVLECTDDPDLKFAANDLCLRADMPLVVAAVLRWRGQVMAVRRGAACYRCIYEAPPPAELAPPCSEAGVLGIAAGTLGWIMAHLAVRLAGGDPEVHGRLLDLDLRTAVPRVLAPSPRAGCPACAGAVTIPRCAGGPPPAARATGG